MKSVEQKRVNIVGYGGHSYLIIEILTQAGYIIDSYIDKEIKEFNPYNLNYLGDDDLLDKHLTKFSQQKYFVSIGDNKIRKLIFQKFSNPDLFSINAIHKKSFISKTVILGRGNFISSFSVINSYAKIGNGVICNTGSIIEHESIIDDFVHIGPGSVICGNVVVGSCSFIGAGAIIKEGIKIGSNVIVGAGSVVISDISDNHIVVGVPAKKML